MIKQYTKKDGVRPIYSWLYLGIDSNGGRKAKQLDAGSNQSEAKLARLRLQTTIQDRGSSAGTNPAYPTGL